MEQNTDKNLWHQASALRRRAVAYASRIEHRHRGPSCTYMGAFLLVIVVGLPIVSVSPLRNRLRSRVELLKEAVLADSLGEPLLVRVGDSGPFPEEYARKSSQIPDYTSLINMPGVIYGSIPADLSEAPQIEEPQQPQDEGKSEEKVAYGQGAIEQEVYALLLESNEMIANMVQGSDPSLQFKTWAAAARGDAAYWVNLTFTRVSDNVDVNYIWEVKLMSKEISPLNYYARSISNP